jgi:hypothetical protein
MKKTKIPKNAKITYVTGDCHAVTPKGPKMLKITKLHVTTTNVTPNPKNPKNVQITNVLST